MQTVDALRAVKKRKASEFPVDRVLDMQMQHGELRFHVSWKGYPPESNTWEPLSSVARVEQLETFLKRLCREREVERAQHKRQLGEEQNRVVMLQLELRAEQRAHGTGGNFELTGFDTEPSECSETSHWNSKWVTVVGETPPVCPSCMESAT